MTNQQYKNGNNEPYGAVPEAGGGTVGTSETVGARARRLLLSQTAGRSGATVEGAWERSLNRPLSLVL